MSRGLIIRHEADADIVEAAAWYEAQSYGLGAEFFQAVDVCIANAVRAPQRYARVQGIGEGDLRRALVSRFPYAVYFYFDDEDVMVIACLHLRRDPGELAKRL